LLRLLADPNYSSTIPALSSLPGASDSLYLDFDGYVANDDWGNYSAAPFDLNGNSAIVTPAERLAVRNIWRTIADDFSPFNVNVTTVLPPSFTDGEGYRVVVTDSSPSIINPPDTVTSAAIFDSYTSPAVNTGFVFANNFGDYGGDISGRVMAAAVEEGNTASYDFGRALGLRDYGGVNAQPSGIMQVPDTGLNRETWSVGNTHSGEPPVVLQDDVAAIADPGNTIGFRPDDHGDTFATATDLGSVTTLTTSGVIASTNDRDIFKVTATSSGGVVFSADVDPLVGNLDAELRVFDAAGQLIISNTPTNSYSAIVVAFVPGAGDYFVVVRSAG